MIRTTLTLSAMSLLYLISFPAAAQDAPPSYQADPDVYKVIFDDQNFRVIEVIRKKGVHDKLHSHSLPTVGYNLTDCTSKAYDAGGKVVSENTRKAGEAGAAPVTPGHSVENTGTGDCKQILVEKK
jgi:hypothetical protein